MVEKAFSLTDETLAGPSEAPERREIPASELAIRSSQAEGETSFKYILVDRIRRMIT